jgi:3-oxoacyl-[acyl-carrier-protein] synthase III
MQAFIVGTGRCLPQRVVTNAELAEVLGTDSEWILKSTGIKTRRWACSSEATSDLAVEAARLAVRSAELSSEAIDYVIAGTMTPDHQIPGIGPLVQTKLGLKDIPCMDVRTACCTPLYAFEVAAALIQSGRVAHVLIVGAEVQSKGLKLAPDAKEISALFGDGAGACIISKVARPRALNVLDVLLSTDGSFAKDLAVVAPGTGNGPHWYDESPQYHDLVYPVMNGKTVILQAARKLGDAARSILQRRNLSAEAIHLVIPHQANENLLVALGRQLKIPESKIVSIVEWSGNTSSASMLIALDWAYEQQLIHSGSLILFLAFGAGFTWGAALARSE